jgi:hypothetical protein
VLLPLPIRTEGATSQVGDVARCVYARGYLVKRLTQLDPGQCYGFEVVEQQLAVGGGLLLLGGSYRLRDLPCGRTEVVATTRYVSPKQPRWLWQPIEASICRRFHRYGVSIRDVPRPPMSTLAISCRCSYPRNPGSVAELGGVAYCGCHSLVSGYPRQCWASHPFKSTHETSYAPL